MTGQYEKLLSVCDNLLGLFAWEEDKPSDLRFRKASVLKEWGKTKDFEGAEKLVKEYISDDTVCNEENDIPFN